MVRKQQTLAIVQEVTTKLVSKEELTFLFETALLQTTNQQQQQSQQQQNTGTNNSNLINLSPSGDSLSLAEGSQQSNFPFSSSHANAHPLPSPGSSYDDERNIIIPKSNVSEIVQRAPHSTENKQMLTRMASGSMNDPSPVIATTPPAAAGPVAPPVRRSGSSG